MARRGEAGGGVAGAAAAAGAGAEVIIAHMHTPGPGLPASPFVSIVHIVPAPRPRPARPAGPRRSPPRARRKAPDRYHHGDLRRALVTAALEAVAAGGVDALNLRDLARHLGVSPGAPYRHFADKDALLAAVADDIAARFTAELDAAQRAAPPDPLSQYRAVGIAYVTFACEHPAHFRVMSRPGLGERLVAGALGGNHEAFRAALTTAQARGEVAALPVDHLMLAAVTLTHGLAHMIVEGHPPVAGVDRAAAIRLATAVTAVLGHGLLPRPGAPRRPARPRRPRR